MHPHLKYATKALKNGAFITGAFLWYDEPVIA